LITFVELCRRDAKARQTEVALTPALVEFLAWYDLMLWVDKARKTKVAPLNDLLKWQVGEEVVGYHLRNRLCYTQLYEGLSSAPRLTLRQVSYFTEVGNKRKKETRDFESHADVLDHVRSRVGPELQMTSDLRQIIHAYKKI
jgi:hypothetical protein